MPDYPTNKADRLMDNLVIEFLRLKDTERIEEDAIISLTRQMLEDLNNIGDNNSDGSESSFYSTPENNNT